MAAILKAHMCVYASFLHVALTLFAETWGKERPKNVVDSVYSTFIMQPQALLGKPK